MSPNDLHSVLTRQLRRCGASLQNAPTGENWVRFLEGINRAYIAADQERYTVERSLEISSLEMEQLHAHLRTERDKLDSVINSLPIGLVELDETLTVSYANPNARAMLELDGEYVGKPLVEVAALEWLPESTRVVASEHVQFQYVDGTAKLMAMLADGVRHSIPDARITMASGSALPVSCISSPIVRGGTRTGSLLLITDMTAARDAERSAHNARVDAEAANKSAEAKSQFLATMSHEIRTPMNGVLGMLQLLLDTDLSDEQREFASTSYRSAEGLLGILNDILDFSKLEAGKYELETLEFGVTDLISDVVGVFSERAHGKKIEMSWQCSPNLPEPLLGDLTRVRQVLTNLVSNAVKFTDEGSVRVNADIEVVDQGAELLCLSVEDTGIGIADESLMTLFSVFTQADISTTRKYGGTGLGLAISRRLAELMGGTLMCRSTLGEGTRFDFKIPLVPAPNACRVTELRERLLGRRMLVVDDGQTQRDALRGLLERWGMRVEVASGAYEALGMALNAYRRGVPFHGALIDERMPKVSGEMLIEMLTQEQLLAELEVVLMSSRSEHKTAHGKARSKLVVASVQKPVLQVELRSVLVEHFQHGEGEASRRLQIDVAAQRPSVFVGKAPSQPPSKRGVVLVVDDNAVNRVLAKKVVEKLGYGAELAENGQEAVDAMLAGSYVAVLMDCMMPIMDGYAATEWIRDYEDQQGRPRLPIIGLTADAVIGARERVLLAGMDDYVTKPIRTEDIKLALNRWCGAD